MSRKTYRTKLGTNKVRLPYLSGAKKLNRRQVKRLKNKLWRIYKRKFQIIGRIKTDFIDSPLSAHQVREGEKMRLYQNFFKVLRQWKAKNKNNLPALIKIPANAIYHGLFTNLI